EAPQLVDPGHRDDDRAVEPGDVPRRGEVDVERGGGAGVGPPLAAGPGDGGDGAVGQAHAAQEVVHGVGDDDVVADASGDIGGEQGEALRLVELRFGAVG